MKIYQITTESPLRNYTYVLASEEGEAFCLDPWSAEQVEEVLKANQLKLKAIINSHEHFDHVMGNKDLVKLTGAEIWAHPQAKGAIEGMSKELKEGEKISLGQHSYLEVLDTPGHTFAHLCLLLVEEGKPTAVFTGDTVFQSGVGNVRNGGKAETLFETISNKFFPLTDTVIVYPGHDYIENNLGFTLEIEPSNQLAKAKLQSLQKGESSKLTTLGEERELNTFFRLSSPSVIEGVSQKLDKKLNSPKEVFLGLRSLRDKW